MWEEPSDSRNDIFNWEDRRSSDRVPLQVAVEYQHMEDFVQDYTINISTGGMALQTDGALQIGDQLDVMLSFPRLLEPIKVSGVVRWAQDDDASDTRTVGLAFQHSDDAARLAFGRLMERVIAGDQSVVAEAAVRVLLADPNPHIARLIDEGLRGHGKRDKTRVAFETVNAPDAQQTLGLLESQPFDLLVVDCELAGVPGDVLIERIRRDRRWRRLPIAAVGNDDREPRERALGAGADVYLRKPLRLVDVLAAINRLVVLAPLD